MAWAIIISLILAGLVFILLELLVIPGTGILGIIGLGLIVFSIWSAYAHHSNIYGHYTLAATLVASVLLVVLAIKSKTWNKAMLQDNSEGKANFFEKDAVKAGDTGIAISRLNPMGKALINNDYYEVNSRGAFIDQEQEITVIKVEGNKIFVKLKS